MTDEERERILAEARATIARPFGEREEREVRTKSFADVPVEDELARWKRQGDEHVAAVARERAERQRRERVELTERQQQQQATNWDGWESWLQSHIKAEHELIMGVMSEVVAELMSRMAKETREQEKKLDELAATLELLRAHNAKRPVTTDAPAPLRVFN